MVLHYTAFTTDPTAGNPAGVVLDASTMTDSEMQRIAAEVGYSESAFVVPVADRRFRVRYFSPLVEVHTTEQDTIVATLTSAPTHSRPATDEELTGALKALRWRKEDLDPRWPAHVAFAGNNHLVLAAKTRERLADLDYDFEAMKQLMEARDWVTVQLFWPETDQLVHARDPFPIGGVVEDPATGSAAAAFGGYLRTLGKVTTERRLTIVQGEDMGRKSELTVNVSPADPRVKVTGAATRIPTN